MQLAQMGKFAEALPYLERANRAAPTNLPLLHASASVLQSTGHAPEAVERYRRAAILLQDNVEVLGGWARALLLLGDYGKALPLLDRALQLDPKYADDGGVFATMLWEADDADLACEILQPLLDRHPAHAGLLRQYGHALEVAERLQEAQTAYERYQALRPNDPAVHVELGKLAAIRGDAKAAHEHYKAALGIDPRRASALWAMTQSGDERLDPQVFAKVQEVAQTEQGSDHTLVSHYAQARHHDSVGEYRVAQFHFERLNALQVEIAPPHTHYSEQRHALEVDAMVHEFSPQLFRRLDGAGSSERRPVFIIGLPRSGTTLLERMLAAHPAIIGVGEQSIARKSFQRALLESGGTIAMLTPAAIEAAANWHLQTLDDRVRRLEIQRNGERVVDKMPDNYMLAGWLRIAFPDAAIIHCLRDPRDVALSCWQTQFSSIRWGFDLNHIAHRIEQHRRIMRHWRTTIGEHLTEIRYEQLVSDPEMQIRRVLETIGLDWHADVLAFAERKGIVRTASVQQVRQPLHTRSVERWRNYESALQPVLARLDVIAVRDALDADSVAAR